MERRPCSVAQPAVHSDYRRASRAAERLGVGDLLEEMQGATQLVLPRAAETCTQAFGADMPEDIIRAIDAIHSMFPQSDRQTIAAVLEEQQGIPNAVFCCSRASELAPVLYIRM